MTYIPLHNHSHYSTQVGLSKPSDIAARCKAIGATACAITDIGNIAGTIAFYKEMTKNKIKPILGCEFLMQTDDPKKPAKMIILARNMVGWTKLVQLVSKSNEIQNYDEQPILNMIDLKSIAKDSIGSLICITGFFESTLWSKTVKDYDVLDSFDKILVEHIEELRGVFGTENVFVSIVQFDNFFNQQKITKLFREVCLQNSIPCVADVESYYCNADDQEDHKILICSAAKITLPAISKKIINNIDTGYNHFFNSNQYHILDYDKVVNLYTESEINNTHLIANMCDEYSPLDKPRLPHFEFPKEFATDVEYLRHLCREGYRKKILSKIPKDQQPEYVERVKYELSVLEEADLSSYFLIVADILDFIRKNGWIPGVGRGSAAGCLVSYLIAITGIDPIKYKLLFERFYNPGRNTKDRIAMPDIDVDVPIDQRDAIIQYIRNKYGADKVAQMITFTTLKGRGALKEVLRVHDNLSFEEMNNITKNIPEESKIADELQDIKEEYGEASIIRWSLENYPEKFKEWCEIDENGNLSGPLAKRFEQAIRLEGTKFHQSKHAAGIAIGHKPLHMLCPMILDKKTNQYIAGLEMQDLDALGIPKFDILGVALLDKLMYINQLIKI